MPEIDPVQREYARRAGARAMWLAKSLRGRFGDAQFLDEMPGVPRDIVAMQRAAVAGGSTQSGGTEALADLRASGEALVAAAAGFVGAFDGMRADSLQGEFHTSYGVAIAHPHAEEVIEGASLPVTMFATGRKSLRERRVGGIIVLTDDLLRFSDAETLTEGLMRQAIARASDAMFVPEISIGAPTIPASGVGPEAVAYDLRRALEAISTSGADSRFHIAIPVLTAKRLSQTVDGVGQLAFRVTPQGGILNGLRCWVSEALTTSALVVDARGLLTASGLVEIDVFRHGNVKLDTAPAMKVSDHGSPPAPTEASMVSLFQSNSAAIRVQRELDYTAVRAGIAAVITGVSTTWGLNDTTSPPN